MRTDSGFCPLCGTQLEEGAEPSVPSSPYRYPDLSRSIAQYNLVQRILLFVTFLGCGVCLMVNLLVAPGFLWSLIVIASAAYLWLAVPPLLRKGVNFAAQLVILVALTSFLAVALDFIIGYLGWSVTYVLPSLLSAGILATALMGLFNRTNWAQIVLYQVIIGVFGFLPLVLHLVGLSSNMVMALVTAGLALASILFTIVFGDRSIKSEFKRRFHF